MDIWLLTPSQIKANFRKRRSLHQFQHYVVKMTNREWRIIVLYSSFPNGDNSYLVLFNLYVRFLFIATESYVLPIHCRIHSKRQLKSIKQASVLVIYLTKSQYHKSYIYVDMKNFNRRNSHGHHDSKRRELAQHAHSHGSHAFTHTFYNHVVRSVGSAIIFQCVLGLFMFL